MACLKASLSRAWIGRDFDAQQFCCSKDRKQRNYFKFDGRGGGVALEHLPLPVPVLLVEMGRDGVT